MSKHRGGTRYIVVYFHGVTVVNNIDIMKLVLAKIKEGDYKWFLEDPGDDYYAYKFEVEIPPTFFEGIACYWAALECLSSGLERAEFWERRYQGEKLVDNVLESEYLARVNDKAKFNGPSSPSRLSFLPMSDEEGKGEEGEKKDSSGSSDGQSASTSFESQSEEEPKTRRLRVVN